MAKVTRHRGMAAVKGSSWEGGWRRTEEADAIGKGKKARSEKMRGRERQMKLEKVSAKTRSSSPIGSIPPARGECLSQLHAATFFFIYPAILNLQVPLLCYILYCFLRLIHCKLGMTLRPQSRSNLASVWKTRTTFPAVLCLPGRRRVPKDHRYRPSNDFRP